MKPSDVFSSAWRAISSHVMRSLLTILGIIVGIASVVLTVGLGLGTQKEVSEQISALGSDLLIVSPGSSTDDSGIRGGFGSGATLTRSDADALASTVTVPDAAGVAAEMTGSASLEYGDTNWTTTVTGTSTSWTEVRSRELAYGTFFTEDDEANRAKVIVLGPDTANELFGRTNVVGQEITINDEAFEIIGVLAAVGSSGEQSLDDLALVPMSTMADAISTSSESVQTIYIKAASSDLLAAAAQEAQALLLNLHGIASMDDADFTIEAQDSLIDTATSVYQKLTVLLTGVAALALLVGGIGVMNIMLVSVTERTREIGLRKALGANPASIRNQFLSEAMMLGLGGGALGVIIGVALALLLPAMLGTTIVISGQALVLAVCVAVGIGAVFGVYPAARAAKLAPIDALRSQ